MTSAQARTSSRRPSPMMKRQPRPYSTYSLPRHEGARAVAVEDADGDDGREAVQHVQLLGLEVVGGDEDRPGDRLGDRRELSGDDHDPQGPSAQDPPLVRGERPRTSQRVHGDQHPRQGAVPVQRGVGDHPQKGPAESTVTLSPSVSPVSRPPSEPSTENVVSIRPSSPGVTVTPGYVARRSATVSPRPRS